MSHKSIRKLIEDAATGLQDDIDYTYGKTTDFNQEEKKSFTYINTSPLNSIPGFRTDGTNYMKQWNVQMAFLKIDKEDSDQEDYSQILDEMDKLVDRFIVNLNFFQAKSDSFVLTVTSQDPAIKVMADIVTGWILSFNILVNDDFEYCEDCP